jgi:hypothetical protein
VRRQHFLFDCTIFACEQKAVHVDEKFCDEGDDAEDDEQEANQPFQLEEGNVFKVFL